MNSREIGICQQAELLSEAERFAEIYRHEGVEEVVGSLGCLQTLAEIQHEAFYSKFNLVKIITRSTS